MADKKLEAWFSYHTPREEQIKKYKEIRQAGRQLAYSILHNCPDCADRSAAIRKAREAVMSANAAIACWDDLSK